MPSTLQRNLPPMEVRQPDRAPERETSMVRKPDLAGVPIEMAKAKLGSAIKRGIGDAPLKSFGDDSMMAKVCAGEKVPEYLARLYQDRAARRRFALALLEEDSGVIVTTTITIPNVKAG